MPRLEMNLGGGVKKRIYEGPRGLPGLRINELVGSPLTHTAPGLGHLPHRLLKGCLFPTFL